MERKSRLLLVSPGRRYANPWDLGELAAVMGRRKFMVPLSLPTLAAWTPAGWDIRIVDEELQPLPRDVPDVVGITATLSTLKRALAIADDYRARGSKVVVGGACTTGDPAQVLAHADSVVVGEAEDVWEGVLADATAGRLQPVYRAPEPFEFRRVRPPRWDLVDTSKLMALGVQVSRGCPFSCEFCIVHKVFGRKMRYRDVDDVVEEIRGLPLRQLFFVDDNLTANKAYARRLMPAIKPLKVSWTCEVSLDVAQDEALLESMAEAGCSSMLIGFESLNPDSLKETGKHHNRLDRYEEAVRRIHRSGIHVLGSFIVGFDADGPEAFAQIRDFAARVGIGYVNLNLLTVAPGTALHDRLALEGRLVDVDTDRLNGTYPSLRYGRLSHAEMVEGFHRTLSEVFDPVAVREKGLAVLSTGAFTRPAPAVRLRDKVRGFAYLLRTYLFTRDRARRRLFLDLFDLGRRKVADMSRVVEYLLFMATLRQHVQERRQEYARIEAGLRANDVPAAGSPPTAAGA